MTEFVISKLDAAKKQLDTAIELFFQSSDEISIHTLACAAHQITHDIASNKGLGDCLFLPDFIEKNDKSGNKKWREILNKEKNFFKHADKDANDQLSFDSDVSKLFIVAAILNISNIQGRNIPVSKNIRGFVLWLLLNEKEWFKKEWYESIFGTNLIPEHLALLDVDRQSFFSSIKELMPA